MAGSAWIPVRIGLEREPEVVALVSRFCRADGATADGDAVALLSRRCRAECEMIGALVKIWARFDELTTDGKLPAYTPELLDEAVGITGFCEALAAVGWLRIEPDAIVMPRFDNWLGQSAKRRLKNSQRQRRRRADSATTSRSKRDNDGARCRAKSATTGQDITGQKRNKTKKRGGAAFDAVGVAFPSALDCGQFRQLWAEWVAHRNEIKAPLTPTATARQLKRLAGFGLQGAIDAVEYTLAQGWRGIRQPDQRGDQAPTGRQIAKATPAERRRADMAKRVRELRKAGDHEAAQELIERFDRDEVEGGNDGG